MGWPYGVGRFDSSPALAVSTEPKGNIMNLHDAINGDDNVLALDPNAGTFAAIREHELWAEETVFDIYAETGIDESVIGYA